MDQVKRDTWLAVGCWLVHCALFWACRWCLRPGFGCQPKGMWQSPIESSRFRSCAVTGGMRHSTLRLRLRVLCVCLPFRLQTQEAVPSLFIYQSVNSMYSNCEKQSLFVGTFRYPRTKTTEKNTSGLFSMPITAITATTTTMIAHNQLTVMVFRILPALAFGNMSP